MMANENILRKLARRCCGVGVSSREEERSGFGKTGFLKGLVIVAGLFVLVAAGPSTAQATCVLGSPNGAQQPGEECDDGNLVNTDACKNDCTDAICGDGVTRAGTENCDSGALNGTGPGKCEVTCQRIQTCDDGFKDGTEACDGPAAGTLPTATCDGGPVQGCTLRVCGDNYANVAANEGCDDGNTTTGDGCDAACHVENCGDGFVALNEECDDGDAVNSDVCTNACKFASCGDGIQCTDNAGADACANSPNLNAVEFCDNGAANGSGPGACNATCSRVQTCNDGFKDGTEQCDGPAPGTLPTATCDAGAQACTLRVCGDGYTNLASPENCDDGNTTNANGTTDVCDSNCRAMACGNGVKSYDGGGVAEECDDGNFTNGDGCDSTCDAEACGNGSVDLGEACDSGPFNGTGNGFCLSDCSAVQVCGNGIKNGTEQCDALVLPSATCDTNCTAAACGDGTTNAARFEQCDDGNTANANGTTDLCDSNCTNYACGNGVKAYRPGPVVEQCDDGNVTNGDGCGATCLVEVCGNGATDPGEFCDQGPFNGQGPGVCNVTCSRVQACNDGFKDGTEACDGPLPGSLPTATCDTNCTAAACGDGFTNSARGEQCDDGNTTNNDFCDSNCTIPGCGNGSVNVLTEACDDGNAQAGDGCFACVIESCGDGFVSPVETCDHGDLNGAGNGLCLSDCSGVQLCGDFVIEGTEQCETLGGNTPACDSNCTLPVCGDQFVNLFAGEVCEQPNTVNGDGCDTNCKLTGCGNGIKTPNTGEQCDDGNNVNADGCDAACGVELCGDGNLDLGEACDNGQYNGFGNTFCLTDCSAIQTCGNGLEQGTEGCDDGNFVDADGCDSNCQPTGCGNGDVTFGEGCDDGNTSPANGSTDFCDSNCTVPSCGNQVVSIVANAGPLSVQEVCDDGNVLWGDGCSGNCLIDEGCGDGTTQGALGENCDDGNTTSGDFCDAACRLEDCGNANKTLNEACDDGNLNNADACIITSVTAGQDPAGPANCALARCGDGFLQAGVESCDLGPDCTASCCDYGPGYETGILGAVCQWEALESGCGGYGTCDKASTIEKQINRYDVLLQRIQQLIQEAKLNAAARKATVLARRVERLEARLSKYCGSVPTTEFCLRDLLDQLGTVLDSLDQDLLNVIP